MKVPQGSVAHENLTRTYFFSITVTITIIATIVLFIPPAAFKLPRALLCELFQIQSVPASTAIEFCFHYAGFLGSFKLILILLSLLRALKRAAFPPSLVNWGLSHFTRTAFSLARAACPYTPVPLSAKPVSFQTSKLWVAFTWALGKHAWSTAARPTLTWV